MKRCNTFLFIILFLISANLVLGQNKQTLKQKQKQIKSEISNLNSLLNDLSIDKKKSEIQIIISEKKIGAREELIKVINYEIILINKEIKKQHSVVDSLQEQLVELREQYEKMVVYAYKNRNATDALVFIFSSDDFNQAYKRLKYIKEIGNFREHQAKQIVYAQKEIEKNIEKLNLQKENKKQLLQNKTQEKIQLKGEEEKLKSMYVEIKKNEQKIRADIAKKRKEDKKIEKQIEKIIQREIEEARKRAEEEARKRREKQEAAGEKPEKEVDYELTPAAKALSDDFASNRSKLPWPIKRGTISAHFGNTRHPVFKDLEMINNGINFITARNSNAQAVFKGLVVAVLVLPNGKNAVLIQHGEYYTMYSNLKKTYVKRGQNVGVGTELGLIKTEDDGKTELHFELWKGKIKQNPEEWLAKK